MSPDTPSPPDREPDPDAWTTADGVRLSLRPIGPGDVGRLKSFIQGLSFGTRYFRFGRGDFMYDDDQLRELCRPEPRTRAQFLVLEGEPPDDHIVGSARYVVQDDPSACELAIVVQDDWRGHHVGARLLARLVTQARDSGLKTIFGRVLPTNRDMVVFATRQGFELDELSEAPLKIVTRHL